MTQTETAPTSAALRATYRTRRAGAVLLPLLRLAERRGDVAIRAALLELAARWGVVQVPEFSSLEKGVSE